MPNDGNDESLRQQLLLRFQSPLSGAGLHLLDFQGELLQELRSQRYLLRNYSTLLTDAPTLVLVTYLGIYAIAAIGFLLRIINLGLPKGLIFDEVYYVDGARDFLAYGVEVDGSQAEFIVHPPVGKWLIAAGIQIFGDAEFGWRISTAVAGVISIILIGLIAQRLFRSRFLTLLATFLATVDGLALVHSRTSLLDNFLTTFILAATYFFIRKNYLAAAIFLGFALGTKWSAAYFIALFGAIALYRAFTHHTGRDLIKPSLTRIATFGIVPVAISSGVRTSKMIPFPEVAS